MSLFDERRVQDLCVRMLAGTNEKGDSLAKAGMAVSCIPCCRQWTESGRWGEALVMC